MNDYLNFWRIYENKDRIPLFISFVIISVASILCIYLWWQGIDNLMHWDIYSELKEKLFSGAPFYFGDLSFANTDIAWYIQERYIPALNAVNTYAYYGLLAAALIGLSFILLGFSRVQGLRFALGALALAAVLISMRTENLFSYTHNYVFIGLFLICGAMFYISNSIIKNINTSLLLCIWLAIWTFLAIIASKLSSLNLPLISLGAYVSIIMVLFTILFIFFTSHEIFASLVWIVSRNSQKGQSSLSQYAIISFVFLANIILIYLETTKYIDENFWLPSPIFLFLINLILGIWGLRKMLDQTQSYSFMRVGMWVYIGFAIIALSTVAFAFATGNDPYQELLLDTISICNLGVGLCFFVHVLINFVQMMRQGLQFHKVLYKAPYSKLIYARIVAVFVVIVIFGMRNYYAYYQLQAGYNNALADYYKAEGQPRTAETFYKNATNYVLYNFKSNLSLAGMSVDVNDKINAAGFFNQALKKEANPYIYAGLSYSLENENMFFDALFKLKEGIEKLPQSHELYTNLAYMQAKAKIPDSSYLSLEKAAKLCPSCTPEKVNSLGFWIENAKTEKLAEITQSIRLDKYSNSFAANSFAISRILNQEKTFDKFEIPADTSVDVSRIALLLNALGNAKVENKTAINAQILETMQAKQTTDLAIGALAQVKAQQQYFREDKLKGIRQLYELASANSKLKKLYQQQVGLWMVKEGLAFKGSKLLIEAGDPNSANLIMSQKLQLKMDSSLIAQAQKLSAELSINNYKTVINKAPLNPYLIDKVVDKLIQNKKYLEAYNTVFYASELNDTHPQIWKSIIKSAVMVPQYEYAYDALAKLKGNISANEYLVYEKLINESKAKIGTFN